MSDISSSSSSVSSDSESILGDSNDCNRFSVKKQKDNILLRLRSREIGSSQAKPQFPVIPERLKFRLKNTLPSSALQSHVFLGMSKCGQLLITYTYTTDVDDRPMSFNNLYKYRLHWWAFVPYATARKVAEVTLFGNNNVYTPLLLAVCQWPSDLTKVVVYGTGYESHENLVGLVGQTARAYVTVTAVPSLNNCLECQKVAASFEEEDIAASWDSCVRFSCLTHGLTIHTSFDVAPPYPRFVPGISMKCDGKVVLNSGNFLHVISVKLENSFRGGRSPKLLTEITHSQPEPILPMRILATSNLNVRMSEYHTLLGFAPSSPFASTSDHNSCDSRSLMEELTISCHGYVASSPSRNYCRPDLLMMETESDESSQISSILSPPLRRRGRAKLIPLPAHTDISADWRTLSYVRDVMSPTVTNQAASSNYDGKGYRVEPPLIAYHVLSPNASPRGQQGRVTTTVSAEAEKAYEFTEKDIEKNYETLSSFRKRRLADKKYEFSEEDFEDSENIVPFRVIRHSNGVMRSPNNLPPSPLIHPPRDRSAARSAGSIGEPPDLLLHHRRRVGVDSVNAVNSADSEASGLTSPSGVLHCDPIEQGKVVLRPQNRNYPLLLSPREQEQWDAPRETSKKPVHVHLENNTLSLPLASQMSPQYGQMRSLATSCSSTTSTTDVVSGGTILTPSPLVSPASANTSCCTNLANLAPANPNSQQSGAGLTEASDASRPKAGCTVQFERRFIEVDDELVSVITDIEDDDESGMTGYHSALPLEVHGSGYVQMQMISNSKAGKLMAPCALVHQMSFDIEQFCYEVAEILCERAGMKFWCCNNYDVEIIEVCPMTGDVICLAFMKIKATVKTKGTAKSERRFVERQQYETSCLLVWNLNSGDYRLAAAGPFEQLSPTVNEDVTADAWMGQTNSPTSIEEWNPARGLAVTLRVQCVRNAHFVSGIRILSNLPALRGYSLTEIQDDENGIAFVL